MNPHPNTPGKSDQTESDKFTRVDRLINAAMDAEASNDFDGANIAWAKIAAMDEASRRSAATLQSGLESLRTPTPTPDVSAKVLNRLGMKQAAKRHLAQSERTAAATLADSPAVAPRTPETRVLKSSRRNRKWYSISPALASFVLGGLASLGLVIAHQYTTSAQLQNTEIVVVPQPLFTQPNTPSELLPPIIATATRVPSLRMGDTSRYDQALQPTVHAANTTTPNYWWRNQAPETLPIMAKERWWTPTSGSAGSDLAQDGKRVDAGQVLLQKHNHNVDLFQLLLGEDAENCSPAPTTIKMTPITQEAKPISKPR